MILVVALQIVLRSSCNQHLHIISISVVYLNCQGAFTSIYVILRQAISSKIFKARVTQINQEDSILLNFLRRFPTLKLVFCCTPEYLHNFDRGVGAFITVEYRYVFVVVEVKGMASSPQTIFAFRVAITLTRYFSIHFILASLDWTFCQIYNLKFPSLQIQKTFFL